MPILNIALVQYFSILELEDDLERIWDFASLVTQLSYYANSLELSADPIKLEIKHK